MSGVTEAHDHEDQEDQEDHEDHCRTFNGPQDIVTVSLCIPIAVNKMC